VIFFPGKEAVCVPEENKTDRKSEDDDGVEAYEKLLNPRVVEHLWVDFFCWWRKGTMGLLYGVDEERCLGKEFIDAQGAVVKVR